MSTRQDGPKSPPISSRRELIEYFEQGCKPASQWVIGTEHEKFPFNRSDLTPVPYGGPRGNTYVLLKVEPHEYFDRSEDDLHLGLNITFVQAAMGDEIEVPEK